MDADLDTLATGLHVGVDDLLKAHPDRGQWRPRVEIVPRISDAELVTLAVAQALLRSCQRGPLATVREQAPAAQFPYLPQQPGYNKRLRKLSATG